MTQKLFLTSFIAMGIVANAYAEPSNTGEFPNDGLMQEDYTYTNAANSDNMDGVYEGTVNAEAEYENILYQLAAGQYLPANSETPIACDQPGYFCPGDQNGVYYSSSNQGLTSCSTVGDGSYTLSDGTGSTNAGCYKACSTSCTNPSAPAHSTNVSYGQETTIGQHYYGSSCDAVASTCSINFDCNNGYHKSGGINLDATIQTTAHYAKTTTYCANGLSNYEDCDSRPVYSTLNAGDWVMDFSYGRVHGIGYCSSTGGISMITIELALIGLSDGTMTEEEAVYAILSVATPAESEIFQNILSQYQNGDLTDNEFVAKLYNDLAIKNTINNTPGPYCYCRITGYTPANGTKQSVYSSWLALGENGEQSAESCNVGCAQDCANDMLSSLDYSWRGYLYNSLAKNTASQCSANTITINWSDVDQQYAGQNNEGTATYGGNINTPFKAATKPGQRFTGWRFSNPTPVSANPEPAEQSGE